MLQFRFVGTACTVGDTEYDRRGQRAQFSAQQAKEVLEGGGGFILEEDFQVIGFTPEELEQFGYAGGFPEPTQAFAQKLERAHELLRTGQVLSRLDGSLDAGK